MAKDEDNMRSRRHIRLGPLWQGESVYKAIELVGTRSESWEKAAAAAVSWASKSLRDLGVRQ